MSHMNYVHLFRVDDRIHAVITGQPNVSRKGHSRANPGLVCGTVLVDDAVRITTAPISCDSCNDAVTAMGVLGNA